MVVLQQPYQPVDISNMIVDKEVIDAVPPEKRRPEVQFGNVETFTVEPQPQPEATKAETVDAGNTTQTALNSNNLFPLT